MTRIDVGGYRLTGEEWSDLLTQQLERHPEFVRAYVDSARLDCQRVRRRGRLAPAR